MLVVNDCWTFQLASLPTSLHPAQFRLGGIWQTSPDLHLIHTLAGHGVLRVGGRDYPTTPQVVLAVPVFERHEWIKQSGEPWWMINIHARLYESNGYPLHEHPLLPVSFTPRSLSQIHRKLQRWRASWVTGAWRPRSTVAAQVMTLVAGYLEQFGSDHLPVEPSDLMMEELRLKMEQSPAGTFDAHALASQAGLSISQFNRRFRTAHGLSPKALAQRSRLAQAQSLLRDTDLPVGQIAHMQGFADIYYFSRWFKSQTHSSPVKFRQWSRKI